MEWQSGSVRDLQVAYIGGGSRGWAWGFMMDLAMDGQLSGTVRLYDIDAEAARQNAVIGNRISAHPDAAARWDYRVTPTLQTALEGADFVVISILPGTFAEMRSDVHAPEAYGIWQSVGDTVGPGGFVRALRTIPMYVQIGEAIRSFAPNAWVINYTNPMSLCIRTLYEVFPGVRAFGCCHEVFGTQRLLAAMLADQRDIAGVARQEIKVNVVGINHFTWFTSASYREMDLFPLFARFADAYYDTGFDDGEDHWLNKSFMCAHRVKFDLFRRYGLIAAAGDRHLAEFVPAYLRDPQTVAHWMFGLTTVDWRERDLQARLARSAALAGGEEPIALKASGEEGHLLLKALLGLGDMVSNVNLPNAGQIGNLPQGAVVETNALFRRGEIRPLLAGDIPGPVHALVSRHVDNQENTLRAALARDITLARSTFLNDPMLAGLTAVRANELLDTMLRAAARYLPGWGV
jgi:alpha-galactosidase